MTDSPIGRGPGILLACLLVAGCGTNIKAMIQTETARLPHAQRVLEAAEPLGLEGPLLEAESEKFESCKAIYAATRRRIFKGHELTFFDFMLSDAKQLTAALLPVPQVERCRHAHAAYDHELDALEEDLSARGVVLPSPDETVYQPELD